MPVGYRADRLNPSRKSSPADHAAVHSEQAEKAASPC